MSNTLTISAIDQSSQLKESCQAVVFAIANHHLALPISAIFKVIYCSSTLSDSIHKNELILFDNQPLTLLNLRLLLAQNSVTSQERSPIQCLIIAQAYQELYAIPVDRPPTLQELTLANIHPLPTTYCKAINRIASHFALTNQQDTKILLLDLHQAAHPD